MLYCLKPYDAQNVLITGLFHPSQYPSPTDAPLVLALKGKEAEKDAASPHSQDVYTYTILIYSDVNILVNYLSLNAKINQREYYVDAADFF